MIEDDGVEVSTVVMPDEVLGGVGDLQAPGPQGLLLQQRLVEGKDHLERDDGRLPVNVTCPANTFVARCVSVKPAAVLDTMSRGSPHPPDQQQSGWERVNVSTVRLWPQMSSELISRPKVLPRPALCGSGAEEGSVGQMPSCHGTKNPSVSLSALPSAFIGRASKWRSAYEKGPVFMPRK